MFNGIFSDMYVFANRVIISLYIILFIINTSIIITSHIDNTQSTGYKMSKEKQTQNGEGTH